MMTRSSVRLREIVVMGSVLRDHFDGMDRALLVAARTARALLVVVLVAVTLAELDDRVLRAAAEAAVALDAVAEGPQVQHVEGGDRVLGTRRGLSVEEPVVDHPGSALAVPHADRDRTVAGYDIAAGEDAGHIGHEADGIDAYDVVLEPQARDVLQEVRVGLLAEGEDDGVGSHRLVAPRTPGLARLVELHDLVGHRVGVHRRDRTEPVHLDALADGLFLLRGVGGHLLLAATVDDDRLLGT